MARDEDDRQPRACRLNPLHQLKTVHAGHGDVRDEAMGLRETIAFEQCRTRGEQPDAVIVGLEQNPERSENSLVVVDDCNDGPWRMLAQKTGPMWIQPDSAAAMCGCI